ncbi:MAG TPA: CRTAC1 family protein [Thermoanaerobaculia bacterium]|nr:CRTAC1 family protein [Thermoanaerobaculia bacterium]
MKILRVDPPAAIRCGRLPLAAALLVIAGCAGREDDAATEAARVAVPPDAEAPPWLEARAEEQRQAVAAAGLADFRFTDRRQESGIDFHHRIVHDAGKTYKSVHYDHGNALAAADVDGDGRVDLFFVNQVGPSELWRNLGGGRFENVTAGSGIVIGDRIGVAASFADLDNDGDPDLYVTTVRDGNLLFENDGSGRFTEVSAGSGVDHRGHSSAALFFDYDRDGLLDLFLANVGQYTGDEVREVTVDGTTYRFYDGFGDAFGGHLKPERAEPSRLYRNLGGLRFEDVTEAVGLDDRGWTGDAIAFDGNGDGWPDLYVLDMQGHDGYWENQQGRRFVDRSRELFPETPWGSMGVVQLDYDHDGRMELYVTDMHSDMSHEVPPAEEKLKSTMHWPESFLLSGGRSIFGNAFFAAANGGFVDRSDDVGAETYWPWGVSAGDLDADGYEDLFVTGGMGYPFRYGINSVLLNRRGEGFVDAEFALGVEPRAGGRTATHFFDLDCDGADAEHELCQVREGMVEVWSTLSSRSSVIFDLDGDGDLDIVTNDFNSPPMVLVSDLAERRPVRFLTIELEGTTSNRSGIGAVVRVRAGGRTATRVHDGKSGYLAQSLLPLYFGLGDAESVEAVEVTWPSGREQLIEAPAIGPDGRLVIREAEEATAER